MFERFSPEARHAVVLAQEEARRLRHNCVGTEHLLLGALAAGGPGTAVLRDLGLDLDRARRKCLEIVAGPPAGGPDPGALATIGIDLDAVRRTVEETFGPGALDRRRMRRDCRRRRPPRGGRMSFPRHIPFTPRSKAALELALREAITLNHKRLGTEHILLGIVREGEGVAAKILADEVGSLDHLRTRIIESIEP